MMDEDHPGSAWSPHSYENISYMQEHYESVEMSRHMGAQTRLPPALVHKAKFPYESSAPATVWADSYAQY